MKRRPVEEISIPETRWCIPDLVERLDHSLLVSSVDRARSITLAELEHRLHNAELSSSGIKTSHSHPVVDNHTSANNRATTVHTASHKRHLQQRAQLILVLNASLRVHDAALVAQAHVAARQDIVRDRLTEDFDAEDVGDDFFGFALEVRVHEGDVVVGADDVAEGGEALCSSWSEVEVGTSRPLRLPAVRRPTIRVPAMVVWQMGITSWSSASKMLCERGCVS
jgi:hypothetical protein